MPPPPGSEPARDERLVPCGQCGQHHRAQDRFCPHCGAAVTAPPAPAPVPRGTMPPPALPRPAWIDEGKDAQPAPTEPPLFQPVSVVYGPPAIPDETRSEMTPPPAPPYPPKATVYGVPAIRDAGPRASDFDPPTVVYGGPAIRPEPSNLLLKLVVLAAALFAVAGAAYWAWTRL